MEVEENAPSLEITYLYHFTESKYSSKQTAQTKTVLISGVGKCE